MQIETLKMFVDLAELRSLSKTGEKHVISQSAVSQQLAQMEMALKCKLLDRKKRPVELTKQGEILFQAATDIIARYEELKRALNTLRQAGTNRLSVAAIFSIGMHSLADYLKEFMLRCPQTNVHVEYQSASRIYELVLTGEVDIGLVAVPKRDARLIVYDFQQEPLHLICNPDHPLASLTEIDITSMQLERFIGFAEDIPTRIWIDGILARYGISVQPNMEFDNIETVKRAVEISAGVSILPAPAVTQEVAMGTLCAIPFVHDDFVRPTGIVVHKNKKLTRFAKDFVRLLTTPASGVN